MRLPILLSILLISTHAISQPNQDMQTIDSLYNLMISKKDTTAILELNNPLSGFVQGNKDTAAYYAREMIRISEELEYIKGIALGYNNLGLAYELNGDLDEGISNYMRAAEYAESLDYSRHTAGMIYNNISIAYSFKGEMELSIEYLLKTIRIAEAGQDSTQLATAYNNLATRYLDLNSPFLALSYLRKAYSINQALGNQGKIGLNFENIGSAHVMLKNYDSGAYFLRRAAKLLKSSNRDLDRLISYQILANMYYTKEDYDSSLYFNSLALDLGDSLGATFNQSDSERLLAMLLMAEGKNEEAVPILLKAAEYSESINYERQLLSTYEQLGHAYAALGNFEKAQEYYALTIKFLNADVTEKRDQANMKLARYQEEKKEQEIRALEKDAEIQRLRADRSETISWAAGISGILLLIIIGGLVNRNRYVNRTNRTIERERQRSDELLKNILPSDVAEELKENGTAGARQFDDVTILFTDFKNFTQFASTLSPQEVVMEIDKCYRAFDEIMAKHNIEKIKTIGDAYMAASGLPSPESDHAIKMVRAATEIRDFMANHIAEKQAHNLPFFEIRIGLHSGPVVAGIVGIKKFAYDIWGDTVNIAARMESSSEPGKINISESTYQHVRDSFSCTARGMIEVKGKGKLSMYFVD